MNRRHPLHLAVALNKKKLVSSSAIQTAAPKAEVLLAMQSLISHMSHNSMNDFGELFKKMFPENEIASKIEIGRTKMSYIINFGPAPYF